MLTVFGQKNFLKISCIEQNMQKWLEMVDLMMSYFETRGHLDQKENYIKTSHVQRKHSSHAVKI